MATSQPYGTWSSPIDARDLATSASFADVVSTGETVLFTRTDPSSGEQRLHRWSPGAGLCAMGELDVRSRVHEYGGGAVAVAAGTVLAVDFAGQRLHRVEGDSTTPVTPASEARVRFGAGVPLSDGRLVVVRETHDGASAESVRNELVLLHPADGTQHPLVSDHDFVGAPRVGPDGALAWLAWDHPDMPWDGAALWVGRLEGDALTDVHRVAGGDDVSVAELAWWGADLVFTEDSTGHWELCHHAPADRTTTRLTDGAADLGGPRWTLGRDGLAVVGDHVVVVRTTEAVAELVLVDLQAGAVGSSPTAAVRPWPVPTGQVLELVAHDSGVVTIEVDTDGRRAVRLRGLAGGTTPIDEVAPLTERPGDLAEPVQVTVGEHEERTHAFFHPPANADATAPEGELPPLVVFLHGGPTSHTRPVRTDAIAYWTTRGFAVADVNYRGSTGFGRAYRNLMRGRWGEIEVADVIAVAVELGRLGMVDPARMAVRGGSAGGFTALAVLTTPDQPFACGTSFFGVADLAALAEHTHKFESRYLDRMVGPLPEAAEVYRQRSPLTHMDELEVPLLVLQGMDDKVVPPEQSQVVVEAARARGLLHAYLTFEGEGHGFRKPASIAAWHEAETEFYRTAMGIGQAVAMHPRAVHPDARGGHFAP
ncbi:prolyl oligopeptidase family serine peptidase [soil metagenome]